MPKQQFDILYTEYNKEKVNFLKKNKTASLTESKIFECIKYLSELNFDQVVIELTLSNSIKFSFRLNNLLLIITQPLSPIEDLKETDVIFTLFKKDDLLLCNMVNVHHLVKVINKYISEHESPSS